MNSVSLKPKLELYQTMLGIEQRISILCDYAMSGDATFQKLSSSSDWTALLYTCTQCFVLYYQFVHVWSLLLWINICKILIEENTYQPLKYICAHLF